jgi:predicted DNA-binding helix-hairpin-helix protein
VVVGAAGETDDVIMRTASDLYQRHRLGRVYYSGFSPSPHPDPNLPAARPPLAREHQLYQADWLIRFYGFGTAELLEGADRNLALDKDPKLAWALRHREFFSVDVNASQREALLRIPGLGVRNVKRLIKARRFRRVTLDDLRRLGAVVERVKFFVVADGHNPDAHIIDSPQLPAKFTPEPQQLLLFETRSGEL